MDYPCLGGTAVARVNLQCALSSVRGCDNRVLRDCSGLCERKTCCSTTLLEIACSRYSGWPCGQMGCTSDSATVARGELRHHSSSPCMHTLPQGLCSMSDTVAACSTGPAFAAVQLFCCGALRRTPLSPPQRIFLLLAALVSVHASPLHGGHLFSCRGSVQAVTFYVLLLVAISYQASRYEAQYCFAAGPFLLRPFFL